MYEEFDEDEGTKTPAVILKEYLIDTQEEDEKETRLYLQHSRRLSTLTKAQIKADEDGLTESLEQAFILLGFDKGNNTSVNDAHAEKLLKAYQDAQGDKEEEGDYGAEDAAPEGDNALEDFIEKNHTNYKKISAWYKLFDVVTASNQSQVLRYSQQQSAVQHPLWMNDHGICTSVPKCKHCGGGLVFEVQLTP